MKVYETPEAILRRIIALMYAESGAGKTYAATDLDWSTPARPTLWGEQAVFVQLDTGSDPLLSVRPENKPHLITVVNDNPNPYKGAAEIFKTPWKQKYPKVGTIIVDGFTSWGEDILRLAANSGIIQSEGKGDRHIAFGDKADGTYIAQPIIGDYGFAQGMVMQMLKLLKKCQQDLNIIVLCLDHWDKPEGGGLDTLVGGPKTVGNKSITAIPQEFDHVFRLVQMTVDKQEGGKLTKVTKRVMYTEKRGPWLAKLRHGKGKNPLPEAEVGERPLEFWKQIIQVTS